MRVGLALALLLPVGVAAETLHGHGWVYDRVGNPATLMPATTGGLLFEGGGADVDEAYIWLCAHANGGDILVLRESGTPAYNPYIERLCPSANSVATLKIKKRVGAFDPFVYKTISQASALFIAGGDQSKYVADWINTPVVAAINGLAKRGVTIGGTSAGNAILAQFAFTGALSSINSGTALANCYSKYITIANGFLDLSPLVGNTITDDHFVTRNRMGRLITFMARIIQDGQAPRAYGIATNEHTAFLMEPDGSGRVVARSPSSNAYFLRSSGPPQVCAPGQPVSFGPVEVYRVHHGDTFNVKTWSGTGGTAYSITAAAGVLSSTQANGKLY